MSIRKDRKFVVDGRYLRAQAGEALAVFVAPLTAAYMAAFKAGKQAASKDAEAAKN